MDRLNAGMLKAPERPVRVLQFGEGNFLRAFVDYMIDIANEKVDFNGNVVLVKPISFGNLDAFHQQDCRYTVLLRGLVDGKPVEMSRAITSVSDAVDAYGEYEKYAAYARLDTLRFIVKTLARLWKLGERFETWLDEACVFTSTLVDRIVTGYPRDEAEDIWQKLGYEDRLLVTGEPFALWVIESEKDISGELPLPDCGLPVIFTDNQKPYKQRKVRILNGAHTSFVPAAFLCGYDYVLDAMNDSMIQTFMQKTLYDEVIPTLSLPKEDLMAFAEAVTGRFKNPYIKHALLSICLNSVSKWRARCMPSLLGYVEREHKLPEHLTFSLAALMALYHGGHLKDGALECLRDGQPYTLRDDAAVLAFFAENNQKPAAELTRMFLSSTDFFGQDLTQVPGLETAVATALEDVLARGMRTVMTERFGG